MHSGSIIPADLLRTMGQLITIPCKPMWTSGILFTMVLSLATYNRSHTPQFDSWSTVTLSSFKEGFWNSVRWKNLEISCAHLGTCFSTQTSFQNSSGYETCSSQNVIRSLATFKPSRCMCFTATTDTVISHADRSQFGNGAIPLHLFITAAVCTCSAFCCDSQFHYHQQDSGNCISLQVCILDSPWND
jgi:hypothetical protein